MLGIALHTICFEQEIDVGIIGQTTEYVRLLFQTLKQYINELPEWLRPNYILNTQTSIEFDNSVNVIGASYDSSSLKGRTFKLVLMDEIAYTRNEDFIPSNLPVFFGAGYKNNYDNLY